ncbi:MAG TPA: hypothetical protein EYH01_09380 [Campylobacterales bacterium]|nr:hypothetical protein [Campylobacterales bacterium]
MSKNNIYLFLILAFLTVNAEAKRKSKAPPVDHMALATMMIYDGSFEKAKLELKLVDTTKKEFDSAKYHSMNGIINMKMQKYTDAIAHFEKAVEETKHKTYEVPNEAKEKFTVYKYLFEKKQEKKAAPKFDVEKLRAQQIGKLYLNISEAHYKLKNYKQTIQSLDLAGKLGDNKPQLYTLRADCYWKLKEHANAFDTLNIGYEKFPKDTTLLKQKFYYYIDLGLYLKALEISEDYFAAIEPKAKDYTAIAGALANSNQVDKAIKVLEKAKLLFPKDTQVGIVLGHLYLKKDMRHTTADLFEKSSYYDKKYTHEAAEMHRRTGAIPHALYLNTQITDKREKVKQKIAIFIDREEFAKVIAMKNALFRYNMLEDENLRYALAYSYFMVKDFTKAEHHLKKLTKSALFSKATMIRKNIEKCKNNNLECL